MFFKFIVHVRDIYTTITYLNLFRVHFCHKLTASCTDGSVRIAGGDSLTYGRIEVCISSSWETVCSDSFWDNTNAGVVCRQLGFFQRGMFFKCHGFATSQSMHVYCSFMSSLLNMFHVGSLAASNSFSNGYNLPVVHSVQCNGTEETIFNCELSFSNTSNADCARYQDASVICQGLL